VISGSRRMLIEGWREKISENSRKENHTECDLGKRGVFVTGIIKI